VQMGQWQHGSVTNGAYTTVVASARSWLPGLSTPLVRRPFPWITLGMIEQDLDLCLLVSALTMLPQHFVLA